MNKIMMLYIFNEFFLMYEMYKNVLKIVNK